MAENKQNSIKNKMSGNKPGTGNSNNNKKNKFNSFLIPVIIGVALLSMLLVNGGKNPIETNWQEFKNEMLLKHEVEKIIIINQSFAEIYIKPDMLNSPKHSEVLNRGLNKFAQSGPHYRYDFPSV